MRRNTYLTRISWMRISKHLTRISWMRISTHLACISWMRISTHLAHISWMHISTHHVLWGIERLDRVEACSQILKGLQIHAHGLRKAHLCNCLIQAQVDGDKEGYKGILKMIEWEEQKSILKWINRATDDPKLGAIPKVKWMEGLQLVDIKDT